MARDGRAKSFDDELLRLRMRLSSAAPAAVSPAALPPSKPSPPSAATDRELLKQQTVEKRTVEHWQKDVDPPPPKPLNSTKALLHEDDREVASAVLRAETNRKPREVVGKEPQLQVLQVVSAQPPVVESPTIDSDRTHQYLLRAVATLEDNAANISDYRYDGEAELEAQLRERMRAAAAARTPAEALGHLPRFVNDPFAFDCPTATHAEVAPEPTGDAVRFDDVVKDRAAAATFQRAQLQQRVDARTRASDVYALPEDIAQRRGLSTQDPLLHGTTSSRTPARRGRPPSSTAPSSVVPSPPQNRRASSRTRPASTTTVPRPATTVDHTKVSYSLYRDPALVTTVHDGKIFFCQACHRVIVGAGEGHCPHCGAYNTGVVATEGNDEGQPPTVLSNPPAVAATTGDMPPAVDCPPLRPGATVAEIEAHERAAFQAAVAAWRTGGPVAVLDDGSHHHRISAKNSQEEPTAFERSAGRVAQLVAASSNSTPGRLYFAHLWQFLPS